MWNILASLFGLSQRTCAPKEKKGQRWRRVFPQVVVVNGAATLLAFFSNCGPCIFTACEVKGYALWGTAETLSTWFVRWYFISLGLLIIFTILSCWCKICVLLEDQGRCNSARAQLLLNTLVVCFNYAVGWLPYVLLVGISGSLDGGSFVEGFESGLTDFHCHLHDASVRGALVVLVASSAIYLRHAYFGLGGRVLGDGYMLMGGLILPWFMATITRVFLVGQEWRLPTKSLLREGSNGTFTMRANMIFCETIVNNDWLNHVMAEWLLTLVMTGLVAFWFPTVRRRSQDHSKLIQRPIGLFASGEYYMESVSVIAIMWFLTIRPLLATSIFLSSNESWSSYLDIPSHVLIMMSASLVPFEVEDRWAMAVEEESPAEEEGKAGRVTSLHGEEGAKAWEEKQGSAIVNSDEHF